MTAPAFEKQGKHGTLHYYVIEYDSPGDEGFAPATWHTWAYSMEHAIEKFDDADDGFRALRIARECALAHRRNWNKV